MLDVRGFPGFYGGSSAGSSRYDGGDRVAGNEIDREVYYDKRARDYYPSYSADRGSRNGWGE
jgi:hypothetical protein